MLSAIRRPIVYISYRWVDVVDQGRPARAPDPRARELADKLHTQGGGVGVGGLFLLHPQTLTPPPASAPTQGLEVRLDVYSLDSLHGIKPPQRVAGDARDPWLVWSERQIAEADAVLMFCRSEEHTSELQSP